MRSKIELYGKTLDCFRANLHMHSPTSDGQLALRESCRIYMAEGYDILAVTDHHAANRVSDVGTGGLLLLSGMEVHPKGPRGITLHLVALNVPEDFPDPSALPYQEAIEAVRAAGGECILAHPYWSGLNAVDIMAMQNLMGIEVYNTSARYIGKAYNMQVWDDLLALGYVLPAVAVDDMHRLRDLFRGWTMICAEARTPAAIMAALKSGSCYATQGPEFHRLAFANRRFSVQCSPCTEIMIMGNNCFGKCGVVPGFDPASPAQAKHPDLEERTFFEADIPEAVGLTYIRCQIVDRNGRMAWSAPIRV
ncbi:MAG: CehA/McbA family metallohydrolase [Lentisphaerae bacterium]|nr:CehA/McbA family metallohydrolase [Lentisphaerota bacterium]